MKNLLIFISLLAFLSCEKAATPTTNVVMVYQMSQCADPWMDANYTANKELALKRFLQSKNIEVISLTVELNCSQQATCLACTCAGCDKATVEVPEDDVADMIALKFKRR
jgi:hypothetical protein